MPTAKDIRVFAAKGKSVVTLILPTVLKEHLQERASRNERSMSAEIRLLVLTALTDEAEMRDRKADAQAEAKMRERMGDL